MAFSRKKIHVTDPVLLHKWPGKTLDEGYTPLPKRLLRCMGKLFSGQDGIDDFRTVMTIVDFNRPNQVRSPSYAYLAFIAGMSEHKFAQRVDALVSRGLMTVTGDVDGADFEIGGLVRVIEELTNSLEGDED